MIDGKLSYKQLQSFIQDYFVAVANKDLVTIMSFYADDATFVVHAAANGGDPAVWGKLIKFKNKLEIQKLYEQFLQDIIKTKVCQAEHVAIDEQQQRIATEQRYVAYNQKNELISLYNCNFFDFNAHGKICRVMNWSANESYSASDE